MVLTGKERLEDTECADMCDNNKDTYRRMLVVCLSHRSLEFFHQHCCFIHLILRLQAVRVTFGPTYIIICVKYTQVHLFLYTIFSLSRTRNPLLWEGRKTEKRRVEDPNDSRLQSVYAAEG